MHLIEVQEKQTAHFQVSFSSEIAQNTLNSPSSVWQYRAKHG